MSAKEVCDALKLTRQQLHYYVKTEQIRKEYNPENPAQFKYNRTDVYALQKKLEKKYDRYSK
jgi:DNA-binding transcriptional MerR regulator